MSHKTRKSVLGSILAGLLACVVLATGAGCDELFGDYGTSDYLYDGGSYYDDGFYSNWYTDTTINGDDDFFYIAGDGFTYPSW